MLYAICVVCATLFLLILVLAAPRTPEGRRLARLFRSQEKWAEMMDRHEEGKRNSATQQVETAQSCHGLYAGQTS